jgi:hypothetical protein
MGEDLVAGFEFRDSNLQFDEKPRDGLVKVQTLKILLKTQNPKPLTLIPEELTEE